MKKTNKLAFTLIELLVVITIIGILATGATSVYTSQIQKARDATRLNDIDTLKTGVEQFYQDKQEYPHSSSQNSDGEYAFSGVIVYVPTLPKDPKNGKTTTNSSFEYIYTVGKDGNGIEGSDYEVSCTFENKGNITNKAEKDGGGDNFRMEMGIDLNTNQTDVSGEITGTTLTCVSTVGATTVCSDEATRLLIKGNP